MNPVAENLTGWNEKKALAQPIEKVFQVPCLNIKTAFEFIFFDDQNKIYN